MQNMNMCARCAREGRRRLIGCWPNRQGRTCKVRCVQEWYRRVVPLSMAPTALPKAVLDGTLAVPPLANRRR
jgi:hypothetical protein